MSVVPSMLASKDKGTSKSVAVSDNDKRKAEYILIEAQNQKHKGNIDACFDLLNYAHSIDSTNTTISYYLGYNLLTMRNSTKETTEQALRLMKQHFDKAPQDYYETSFYSEANMQVGNPQEALKASKKLAEIYPNKIEVKDQLAANLAKKTELCEKAEALKDSTDWKKTTDALVELQKEWKTVGPVVKKHSEAVWKRFIAACDHFFEEKKKQSTNIHVVEHENLKQKKEVVAAIKTALENETPENGAKVVRELMAKWQTIGHVPYKEKDKIYGEYKEAIDEAFDKFDMKSIKANLSNFETSINSMSGSDKVMHERERLVRGYEQKCNELKVLENNLGFFNARSKTGNSIVKEVERKIAKIKDEISLLEKKIKMIDEKL